MQGEQFFWLLAILYLQYKEPKKNHVKCKKPKGEGGKTIHRVIAFLENILNRKSTVTEDMLRDA